jgi:GTP1/Obg family GTP-binding protein
VVSREEAEEPTQQACQGRVDLRRQRAQAQRRLGETQHAVEETMHRTADKLPDPEEVHKRARELSEVGDRHLRRAEQIESDLGEPHG